MADKHEFDDFDSILKSIDSAADGAADDVNLDELLAQLSVEFPADFGAQTPSQKAREELSRAQADSAVEEAPKKPARPPKQKAPAAREQSKAAPREKKPAAPPAPPRECIDAVRRALEHCAVPVCISPGNHASCTPSSPWLTAFTRLLAALRYCRSRSSRMPVAQFSNSIQFLI